MIQPRKNAKGAKTERMDKRKPVNFTPGRSSPIRDSAYLQISKTVEVHRGHIKERLALKEATSLVRHAVLRVQTQKAEP